MRIEKITGREILDLRFDSYYSLNRLSMKTVVKLL